eukprot:scaffold248751_cov103-Cyclotella_meneghiniana.AAC.2
MMCSARCQESSIFRKISEKIRVTFFSAVQPSHVYALSLPSPRPSHPSPLTHRDQQKRDDIRHQP